MKADVTRNIFSRPDFVFSEGCEVAARATHDKTHFGACRHGDQPVRLDICLAVLDFSKNFHP